MVDRVGKGVSVEHVAKSIHQLGRKYGFRRDAVPIIKQSFTCGIQNYPFVEDLVAMCGLLFAFLGLYLAPYLSGYFTVLVNQVGSSTAFLDLILSEEPCLIKGSLKTIELARWPNDCASLCHGLDEIPSFSAKDFTREEFSAKYAYTGRPVIVRGVARDWAATKLFDFPFLKRLFAPQLVEIWDAADGQMVLSQETFDDMDMSQFLPDYVTETQPEVEMEFTSLVHLFNMSESRWRLGDPSQQSYLASFNNWMFKKVNLRQYFGPLGFLPIDAVRRRFEFVWMAGSAAGQPRIGQPIRNNEGIRRPWWQAAVKGGFSWQIYPPSECAHVCQPSLEGHVGQGDVIVMDSAIWHFNVTFQAGGPSIVIASEFD